MSDTELSPVHYQALLPLAWVVAGALDAARLSVWMHTNAILLRALATIEAQPPATDYESEPGTPTGRMLERLEAKIDLSLSLLSRLLGHESSLQQALPVTLSANAVEWESASLPEAGSEILLTLHLSPKLPHPLQLPARVERSGNGRALARFTHLDEETRDWLERTVFRQHRRHIQALHQGRSQNA